MKPSDVKRLEVGHEISAGSFCGRVTCVDLTDDDKIVIKWDCAESEDVLSETSPPLVASAPALMTEQRG